MFPEHRELISQLKTTDRYFSNLFDKHNVLDQKIKNIEARIEPGTPEEIDVLKKEKGKNSHQIIKRIWFS